MIYCIGNEPSGNLMGIVIGVGKHGHKKKVYVYSPPPFFFFFFVDIFTKLWKVSIGFVMSVCPHGTAPWLSFNRFSLNWYLSIFLKLCQENSNFLKIWPVTAALLEDLCTFVMISCWILLRIRNVSNKYSVENKTHIICSKTFILNHALHELKW